MKKLQNSIKYGDVFRLGEHILAYGDCRDAKLIAKAIGARKVKTVICDVPYGIDLTASKENFKPLLKNKNIVGDHAQSDAEYATFTREWIEALKPHLAAKNSFYIFNSDRMIFALRQGMFEAGLKFSQLLVWVKTSSVVGRLDYAPMHELIAVGWHGTHEFLKPKDRSVLIYPKPKRSPRHPSTKPVGLIRRLVLNTTKVGDVVFDGFLGSGTALWACHQTGRVCIGVEIDGEYVEQVIESYYKLTGIKAQKIYGA